ncbi:uncharacterized protein LOC121370253 isoform X2 [Gigantopelta aegis]|uniref:uncharacterized protein LOC121370253 isoform X2 n=1 Tax=Gigantopelta aegis TaxID=1735272 RepID=UPI001B88D35A|nr:uncharacterized protein LOC121370253 isoform X2 [Gigantopelta aegis]
MIWSYCKRIAAAAQAGFVVDFYFYGPIVTIVRGELAVAVERKKEGEWVANRCVVGPRRRTVHMTSKDMLSFLTQKLKSQSINEVHPFHEKEVADDEERDSGTESDDEIAELEDIAENLDDDRHRHDGSSYGSASPVNHPTLDDMECLKTHEMTATSLTSSTYTSSSSSECLGLDMVGGGGTWGDGEQHSSEEELAEINDGDCGTETRSMNNARRSVCDSAGSSDDEVRELFDPQPVLFRSSPPQSVHKLVGVTSASAAPPASPSMTAAKLFLTSMSPIAAVAAISSSSRKRHRQPSTSESLSDMEATAVMHRPCLDFEKMQKTSVKKPCVHNFGRPKIVKIRTMNGASRVPKCLFDPAIFSFRSINRGYSALTPVEEPSCAY